MKRSITLTELRSIIIEELLEEKKIREAELQNGTVSWGSKQHIKDLERRISELTHWRSKHKKGSETRANYSRIIQKLKNELQSALKASEK